MIGSNTQRRPRPTAIHGILTIKPPLDEAERDFLTDFAVRPGDTAGLPGDRGCPWVPDDSGKRLVWDGPDAANAADWLNYLRDHILAPTDSDHSVHSVHPSLTARHVIDGHAIKFGADGSRSTISVYGGSADERRTCTPAPSRTAVCVIERNRDFDLDREYDAAFDLGWNQFSEVTGRQRRFDDVVKSFILNYSMLDFAYRDETFTDSTHQIMVVPRPRGEIWIDLYGAIDPTTFDARMRALLQLCCDLACHLNWVAYVPAARVSLRPTSAFADRIIQSHK